MKILDGVLDFTKLIIKGHFVQFYKIKIRFDKNSIYFEGLDIFQEYRILLVFYLVLLIFRSTSYLFALETFCNHKKFQIISRAYFATNKFSR